MAAPTVDPTASSQLIIHRDDNEPVEDELACNPEDLDNDLVNCVCTLIRYTQVSINSELGIKMDDYMDMIQ